ncbi:MAG TPA: ABC transporter ATP-binding protein [Bacteroidetes bacterium]|jgi:ABC-2 type transport system ATP-binding protein|nr:ABC transporter ATP-binding protein [Bacteroidota bacterium]
MPFFEAINVTKQFGDFTVLDNVSISVPKQSIYGLLGPNGAGKTTLIRIINQIMGPDRGELYLNGHKLSQQDIASIGYLPEERGLYKKMKVGEQVLYLARLKGLSRSEAMSRIKLWFKRLEITGWWDKKVEELSKGMQQKVQFISTVLHEPKLLIFDEPFSGFDPVNANIIKNEILYLRDKGATIILSTHNMASVEELCDNITLINRSKSILEGKVSDIREQWSAKEYEIIIEGTKKIEENEHYTIISQSSSDSKTKVKLRANDGASINDILGKIIPIGEIISVNPTVPSMNDIFIRVVNESR